MSDEKLNMDKLHGLQHDKETTPLVMCNTVPSKEPMKDEDVPGYLISSEFWGRLPHVPSMPDLEEEEIPAPTNQNAHELQIHADKETMPLVMCNTVPGKEPMKDEDVTRYLASEFWSELPHVPSMLDLEEEIPAPTNGVTHNLKTPISSLAIPFQEYTDIDGLACYRGKAIMNCCVRINCLINTEPVCKYDCTIYINGKSIQKDVEVDIFKNGSWLNKIPGFAVMLEADNADKRIKNYLNKVVLEQGCNNERYVFSKPGWQIIWNLWKYVSRDGIIGETNTQARAECGQRFPSVAGTIVEYARAFLGIPNITPNSWVATVIMVYTVMSFLYSLYEAAGFTPKLAIFLFGPSGSRKTSLCLAATQIEQQRDPKFILKSTSAGLEAHFKEYRDAVMVIDDLAPTPDRTEEKRMLNNLELLIRVLAMEP